MGALDFTLSELINNKAQVIAAIKQAANPGVILSDASKDTVKTQTIPPAPTAMALASLPAEDTYGNPISLPVADNIIDIVNNFSAPVNSTIVVAKTGGKQQASLLAPKGKPTATLSIDVRAALISAAIDSNVDSLTMRTDKTSATGAASGMDSTLPMNIKKSSLSINTVSASESRNEVTVNNYSSVDNITAVGISGKTIVTSTLSSLTLDVLSSESLNFTAKLPAYNNQSYITLVSVGPDGNADTSITLNKVSGTTDEFSGTINGNSLYIIADNGVACFVAGTRVLTQEGYKAVETLTETDRIVTSGGHTSSFKLTHKKIDVAIKNTAPYLIEAHAFGPNIPAVPLSLSPNHMIQIQKDVWDSPRRISQTNIHVTQYGIGEPVLYYHIRCESYLRDNIITEGMVVESLGERVAYMWNHSLNGYTRPPASE